MGAIRVPLATGAALAIEGESAHMQLVDTRTDDFAAPFDNWQRLPTSLPK